MKVKYVEVENIGMSLDDRETNIIRDNEGEIIDYKQSKYTCRTILKDKNREELFRYIWVAKNKDIARIISCIAENEDLKYPPENGLLGRNMVFLAWIYPIFKDYLEKHGFEPPRKQLEKAIQFK